MGTACYTGDKLLPGALHGVTVRSQVARGMLRGIHLEAGIPWTEFTIVTAADISGRNLVASVVHDQPFLVGIGEEITHLEQPVVLLAHPDRHLAELARKAVRLEVEERPAIFDIQASLDLEQVIYGTDNLLKEIRIQKGEPATFRGFGAPQSLFAVERHMDVCARRLGLNAVELRRRNFLHRGDTLATGQVIREELDLGGLMDRALQDIGYYDKRAAFAINNRADGPIKRGVGFSVFMHGCGFTGSGESHLASVAGIEGLADGTVSILAAATEMGQGKNTVFSQIVAEALQLPCDLVDVAAVDTDRVPNSGPTVASRSTMIVGRILEDAAIGFKQSLVQQGFLQEPYTPERFREPVRSAVARLGSLRCYGQYHRPAHIAWNDATYQGDAYPTYAWACYAAEVAVDLDTFEVKVADFVAAQEVGRVVNPALAAGQIEGGVAQGIGWGLWEEVTTARGRMINNQMTNYIIPTSADLPRIKGKRQSNATLAMPSLTG